MTRRTTRRTASSKRQSISVSKMFQKYEYRGLTHYFHDRLLLRCQPAVSSCRLVHSRVVHPCFFVLCCPLSRCPPLLLRADLSTPALSTLAISAPPSVGCSRENYSNQVLSERWRWQWCTLWWNQGKDGYNEACLIW